MSTLFFVHIVGRLGSDVELRHSASGVPVGSVNLAVDQFDNDGKKTKPLWQRVVAFKGSAEHFAKWTKKGDLVNVMGELRERTWYDADKNPRVSREVVVSRITLLPNGERPAADNEASTVGEDVAEIPSDLP
jgi:single-strand DNA-binding protein